MHTYKLNLTKHKITSKYESTKTLISTANTDKYKPTAFDNY